MDGMRPNAFAGTTETSTTGSIPKPSGEVHQSYGHDYVPSRPAVEEAVDVAAGAPRSSSCAATSCCARAWRTAGWAFVNTPKTARRLL